MKAKCFWLLALWCAENNLPAANFWLPLGGPSDSVVYAQAVNPVTGDLFASFPTRVQPDGIVNAAALYRSANQGDTWTPLTNGLDGVRVLKLATDGTGAMFIAAHSGGVFRSDDNGASWQPATNGLGGQSIISVEMGTGGTVFAGSIAGGIFRTTNNGTNWSAFNTGLTNQHVNVLLNGGGAWFAGTEGGVFRSFNLGTNWLPASAGLTNLTNNALAFAPNGDLIAGTAAGIFRSANLGTNWSPFGGALPNTDVRAVAADAAGNIFAGTASGLFILTNGATAWATADLGITATNFSIGKLNQDSAGRWFAGTALGVFRSTNSGATWQPMNQGLAVGIVRTLLPTAGELFAGTLNAGLYRSRDLGATWARMTLSNTPATTQIFSLGISPSNRVFAGTYLLSPVGLDTHVFRSDDGGDTWQGAATNTQTAHVVGGFAFGSAGEMFATRGFNTSLNAGVMRSDDGGVHWTPTGLSTVVTYSVRRSPAGHLFAGTESLGVYRSLDNGTNWSATGPNAGNVLALAINAAGHVFAASSSGATRGLYRTHDNGTNWVNVLPNTRCGSVVITMTGVVYCGAAEGIFCSTNNGTNWTASNSGMPTNTSVISLAIGPDGMLYAGSGGAGVFRSALPVNPVSTLSAGWSNGMPTLQLRGQPAQNYTLLTSTNLLDWTPAGSLTTAADGDAPPFPVTNLTPLRFYRAVWP